jgi:hypothetical protein
MIKKSLILVLLFSAYSCVKKTNNSNVSDDYVLIEFAAKLEEEDYRIYPEPLENYSKKPAD